MTDWLSGTAMLLSGLIVGFMFLYGMKRRDERNALERKDLEAKRDALVARLRTETDAGERTRLEMEAASVLRRLDDATPVAPAGVSPTVAVVESSVRGATIKGFAWGVGSMIALAAIGYFVYRSSQPKAAESGPSDALKNLEAAVQKNPNDLNARDDLAKEYLDRENMQAVVEQTQYVLQRAPDDARALTYEALVRAGLGQEESALQMMRRATQSDPNLLDAWIGLAWLSARAGKIDDAKIAIDEAKKRRPDEAQRLDQLLARIAPSNPIHVTLTASKAPTGGVLFVIARAEGVTAGPPIAVKRLPIGAFPMDVEISSADSMTGQQLPAKVRIEARVDSDGDPLTKTPTDLTAAKDGIAVGQTVTLTLR